MYIQAAYKNHNLCQLAEGKVMREVGEKQESKFDTIPI
jgi:hypothetical protein